MFIPSARLHKNEQPSRMLVPVKRLPDMGANINNPSTHARSDSGDYHVQATGVIVDDSHKAPNSKQSKNDAQGLARRQDKAQSRSTKRRHSSSPHPSSQAADPSYPITKKARKSTPTARRRKSIRVLQEEKPISRLQRRALSAPSYSATTLPYAPSAPPAPQPRRLRTPDLPELCGGRYFCDCCDCCTCVGARMEDEDVPVASKMDTQLQAAMQHMRLSTVLTPQSTVDGYSKA